MSITVIIATRSHNVSPGDMPAYLRHLGLTDRIPLDSHIRVEAGAMHGEQTWLIDYPELENDEHMLFFVWDEPEPADIKVLRWVAKWQAVVSGHVLGPRWTDVSTTCMIQGYDPAKLHQWLYDWMVENFLDDRVARLTRDIVS
jgi:hypothetical protein